MRPGDIYRHEGFYTDPSTGESKAKFLLLLAVPERDDIVARLLTSRAHGRPETPPCYHGLPYSGYFLGVPGGPLTAKTWVDLHSFGDLDVAEFHRRNERDVLRHVLSLSAVALCPVLECVASADDTTRQQERHLRDLLATLRTSLSAS